MGKVLVVLTIFIGFLLQHNLLFAAAQNPETECTKLRESSEFQLGIDAKNISANQVNTTDSSVEEACHNIGQVLEHFIYVRPKLCDDLIDSKDVASIAFPDAGGDLRRCLGEFALQKFKSKLYQTMTGDFDNNIEAYHFYKESEHKLWIKILVSKCKQEKNLSERFACFERSGIAFFEHIKDSRQSFDEAIDHAKTENKNPTNLNLCAALNASELSKEELLFIAKTAESHHTKWFGDTKPQICSQIAAKPIFEACAEKHLTEQVLTKAQTACLRGTLDLLSENTKPKSSRWFGYKYYTSLLSDLKKAALELDVFERLCTTHIDFKALNHSIERDLSKENKRICHTEEFIHLNNAEDPLTLLSEIRPPKETDPNNIEIQDSDKNTAEEVCKTDSTGKPLDHPLLDSKLLKAIENKSMLLPQHQKFSASKTLDSKASNGSQSISAEESAEVKENGATSLALVEEKKEELEKQKKIEDLKKTFTGKTDVFAWIHETWDKIADERLRARHGKIVIRTPLATATLQLFNQVVDENLENAESIVVKNRQENFLKEKKELIRKLLDVGLSGAGHYDPIKPVNEAQLKRILDEELSPLLDAYGIAPSERLKDVKEFGFVIKKKEDNKNVEIAKVQGDTKKLLDNLQKKVNPSDLKEFLKDRKNIERALQQLSDKKSQHINLSDLGKVLNGGLLDLAKKYNLSFGDLIGLAFKYGIPKIGNLNLSHVDLKHINMDHLDPSVRSAGSSSSLGSTRSSSSGSKIEHNDDLSDDFKNYLQISKKLILASKCTKEECKSENFYYEVTNIYPTGSGILDFHGLLVRPEYQEKTREAIKAGPEAFEQLIEELDRKQWQAKFKPVHDTQLALLEYLKDPTLLTKRTPQKWFRDFNVTNFPSPPMSMLPDIHYFDKCCEYVHLYHFELCNLALKNWWKNQDGVKYKNFFEFPITVPDWTKTTVEYDKAVQDFLKKIKEQPEVFFNLASQLDKESLEAFFKLVRDADVYNFYYIESMRKKNPISIFVDRNVILPEFFKKFKDRKIASKAIPRGIAPEVQKDKIHPLPSKAVKEQKKTREVKSDSNRDLQEDILDNLGVQVTVVGQAQLPSALQTSALEEEYQELGSHQKNQKLKKKLKAKSEVPQENIKNTADIAAPEILGQAGKKEKTTLPTEQSKDKWPWPVRLSWLTQKRQQLGKQDTPWDWSLYEEATSQKPEEVDFLARAASDSLTEYDNRFRHKSLRCIFINEDLSVSTNLCMDDDFKFCSKRHNNLQICFNEPSLPCALFALSVKKVKLPLSSLSSDDSLAIADELLESCLPPNLQPQPH